MNRKLEKLAAKLAFDEIDAPQAEKLRESVAEDAEAARRLGEYEGMRLDLRKLAERTPECTVSADRLRDAILGDGLNEARTSHQNWGWVWAPIATGVLAFALFAWGNRNAGRGPVEIRPSDTSYASGTGALTKPEAYVKAVTTPSAAPAVTPPAGAKAATGWWAMCAILRAARCSSGSRSRRKGLPANGPTPPRANMATCSMSSAKAADWSTSRMSPMRHVRSSACRILSPSLIAPARASPAHRQDRRRRRGGSLPCRSRSNALS